MGEQPQRRRVAKISIEADEWSGVLAALDDIYRRFDEAGPGRNIVSGGVTFSYIAVDSENPAQNHEAYFAEVDAWLAEQRACDCGMGDGSMPELHADDCAVNQ